MEFGKNLHSFGRTGGFGRHRQAKGGAGRRVKKGRAIRIIDSSCFLFG
ncbi:hypothetical protein HMPREF0602_0594 [Neisseria meningitidis ATCC 13091]|uniref:Uncharacterized protein n=1 Tax=Neisseria meningitidis serogroup B (strain ATCC 13091 / M2091) TaxID=862513 RepID=E0N7W4_NEIM3|nr:hypothetical protein HMPREF0602_0594 [Neisseria meningitidis ATCC 13091]